MIRQRLQHAVAGGVDEDVDAAQLADGVGDGVIDLFRLAGVAHQAARAAAQGTDPAGDGGGPVLGQVGHGHVGPVLGQGNGNGRPDGPGPAGDQRHAAVETKAMRGAGLVVRFWCVFAGCRFLHRGARSISG